MCVEIAHPLVDLGALVKVVDEARLYRETGDAHSRDSGQGKGDGDRSPWAIRREAAQRLGRVDALAVGAAGGALRKQHDDGGKEHERDRERDGDPDGHHPAEIDDRDDAGTHERAEGNHGCQGGVETRQELVAQRRLDAFADGLTRRLFVQFAIANDQVNVQRDADDHQQRDEVRGNHRYGPVERAEEPEHVEGDKGTGRDRQEDPAGPAEEERQRSDDQQQDGDAEGFEVTLHEAEHVIGDHGHAAEMHGCLRAVGLDRRAHGLDQRALARGCDALVGVEFASYARKLGRFLRAGLAGPNAREQRVPPLQELRVAQVAREVHLQRRHIARTADEKVGVERARGELDASELAVRTG